MSSKFNRITEIFLIGLAILPIVMFLDLIIAAIMLYTGVNLIWIVVTIIFVILLIPIGIISYFIFISFEEYDKVIVILNQKDKQPETFEISMKFKMKDLLRLIWLHVKENRQQKISWVKSVQFATESLVENDLKPFLVKQVEYQYGIDSANRLATAKYYEIELNFE